MQFLFATDAWSSKISYSEAELRDINNLNGLLIMVKSRGGVTDDLRAELDAIAGDSQSCVTFCVM